MASARDVMARFEALRDRPCPACGRTHHTDLEGLLTGPGVLAELPKVVGGYGRRPFLLADVNTYRAAGARAEEMLNAAGLPCRAYVFSQKNLEPDETALGSAVMHFDTRCDVIVTVGSGTLHDIGKMLSRLTGLPYVVVCTAPSMDGYASATSSMVREGLKVSLDSRCPNAILGDVDILKNAPLPMLQAGLGDMLAKYVSLCEWRIAHLLVDEYYCPEIAGLVRASLDLCVSQAPGLVRREPEAVEAVLQGLVISGAAMAFAGLSRPASGVEHYFSHIWDMRGLAFHHPMQLHGLQCAVGTVLALRGYEALRGMTPDRERALDAAAVFDFDEWSRELAAFVGPGAEAMIKAEEREGKYDKQKHGERLERILRLWPELLAIMDETLPASKEVAALLESMGAPSTPSGIGIDPALIPMSFKASKDIRDKYVLSRLAWDLGFLSEIAETLV